MDINGRGSDRRLDDSYVAGRAYNRAEYRQWYFTFNLGRYNQHLAADHGKPGKPNIQRRPNLSYSRPGPANR